MFATLVESKPRSMRRRGGMFLSFATHYGLVLVMVYTSAQASTVRDGPRQERIDFVEPEQPTVAKAELPPPELIRAPRPPRSQLVLSAPIHVPDALPDIDLTRGLTDPGDFSRGVPRAEATGSDRGTPAPARDVYLASELAKPVLLAPNSATPAYPDILRQAGVEGEAMVSFVVDTSGRVDTGTFTVIQATHHLFATAVRTALPRMRFIPAQLGEKRVRQLVQQPYRFTISR